MKYLVLNISFLFSVLGIAQKAFVTLEIEPKEIIAGETITLSVRTNIQGTITIDLPSVFEEGYDVMNGMEQQVDYTTGRIMTLVYRTQTGTISKAGTYKLGPATIKKGFKTYTSNSVTIKVLANKSQKKQKENISSKQLTQPGFGIIEKSKNSVYAGEALVVEAKVYSRFNPSHLEDYVSYSMNGLVDAHEIGNSNRILVQEENYKGQRFYAFVYDKKVVFPSSSGTLKIEPFELILRSGFEGLPITSSKSTVTVKPLPTGAPENFTGAVGKIALNQSIQAKNLQQGDVFTVILQLEGSGNLHLIDVPALQLTDAFTLYGDPTVEEDFTFGTRGAEGKIIYTYNIQVLESGKLTLPATKISYFDTEKDKYIELISPAKTISVSPNEEYASNPTLKEQENQKKGSANQRIEIKSTEISAKESSTVDQRMLWLGSILLLLIIGASLWYFRKKEPKSIQPLASSTRARQPAFDTNTYLREMDLATNSANDQQFCSQMDHIIRSAAKHKLGLMQEMQLSKMEILHHLSENGMTESHLRVLQDLLSTCEEARYGMSSETVDRTKIREQARLWVQSLSG